MPKPQLVTHEEYPFYTCKRCEINTLTPNRMCPCPRGGCEAVAVGKVVSTSVLVLDSKRKNK